MKRLILLLLFVVAFSVLSLAARSNDYTDVISVAPTVSFQRILYEVPQYNNKNGIGLGLLACYDSFKTDSSSLGLQVSVEYFDYPNSYDFIDLKLSGTFKFRLIPLNTPDTTARLFMSLGAGADFVFREDGDFGTYIHLTGGLEFILYGDDRSDVVLCTDVAGTFQQGSTVFHASVGLGVRMGFGEKFETAKPEPEPVAEEPAEETKEEIVSSVIEVVDAREEATVEEEILPEHIHTYNILPEIIIIERTENGLHVKWFHVCLECGELIEGCNPFYDALYGTRDKGDNR